MQKCIRFKNQFIRIDHFRFLILVRYLCYNDNDNIINYANNLQLTNYKKYIILAVRNNSEFI